MKPRRRRFAPRAVAVVALLTGAAAASAQRSDPRQPADEEGPIVIGQQQENQGLVLTDLHTAAEFLYRFENDSNKQADGTKTEVTSHLIRSTVNISTAGYIVHPNLVDFTLAGAVGPSYDIVNSNSGNNTIGSSDVVATEGNSSDLGYLYTYDFSAVFLRKEMAPITVFSNRSEELVNREFSGTLDSITMTSGARTDIHSPDLPTRLNLYHTDQDQKDAAGNREFKLGESVFEWHSENRPTTRQLLQWDFAFHDVHQENPSGSPFVSSVNTDFETVEATLSHSLDFGDTVRPNNLSSTANYFKQVGDFPQERIRLDEALQLRHEPNLDSFYHASVDREEREDLTQTMARGDAGVRYRVFDSLIMTGRAGGSVLDQSGGSNTEEIFTNGGLDYRKKVPLGTLTLTLGLGVDQQYNQTQNGGFFVSREPHTFVDPQPVVLNNQNAIVASIVVTDAAGIVTFTPGVDYTVTTVPGQVQIHRVPGQLIANGQSVLVSYNTTGQPNNTTTTTNFSFGARYDIEEGLFTGLGIYSRFFVQNQTVTAAAPGFIADNINDYIVGADYRIWELSFNAEYELHDSSIAPYHATRFGARFTHHPSELSTLGASAEYDLYDYTQEHNRVDLLYANANFRYQFTRELYASLTAAVRDQLDQLNGDSFGIEAQGEVGWQYRQTKLFLQVRSSYLRTGGSVETSEFIELGIHRDF